MATLIDSPEFTANEIYQIAASDPVEGAATGASFGGLGIDNKPHQQLANRTALLRNQQLINIANIAALQAFVAEFVGSLQKSGYIEIPIADVSRGAVVSVLQWGAATVSPVPGANTLAVNWPLAFPNAALFAVGLGGGSFVNSEGDQFICTVAPIPTALSKTSGSFSVFSGEDPEDADLKTLINMSLSWLAVGF